MGKTEGTTRNSVVPGEAGDSWEVSPPLGLKDVEGTPPARSCGVGARGASPQRPSGRYWGINTHLTLPPLTSCWYLCRLSRPPQEGSPVVQPTQAASQTRSRVEKGSCRSPGAGAGTSRPIHTEASPGSCSRPSPSQSPFPLFPFSS